MARGIRLTFNAKLASLKEKLEQNERQLKRYQDSMKAIKAEISSLASSETSKIFQDQTITDSEKLAKIKALNDLTRD